MFEQKNSVINLADCVESNCRMCLKRFEEYDLKLQITENIKNNFEKLVNIELKLSTRYPQYICITCHNKLARFANYRQDIIQKQDLISIFNGQRILVDSSTPNAVIAKVLGNNKEQVNPEIKFLIPDQEMYEIDEDRYQDNYYQMQDPTTSKMSNANKKDEDIPFKCEFCFKEFKRQRTLNEHRDKIHYNQINYFCDNCGYGAFKKYDLKRHMRTHISKEFRKTYECNICHIKLLSPEGLKRHIKNIHSTTENYHCNYCYENFFRVVDFNSHMDSVHGTKTLFACNLCNDFYGTRYSLRKHKKDCKQKI
ncbi:hypothetical protein PVAND_009854 [Polypedilum vanderplanki]|uniref:Zinc finger protein n=1 Tax=Polypedilum vanderplanki TaxID=319348 RepID=A0A9J6CEI4_POLVA|nr:hypothetical protein PVAND_009854 [Polypedilum vanderplanki]